MSEQEVQVLVKDNKPVTLTLTSNGVIRVLSSTRASIYAIFGSLLPKKRGEELYSCEVRSGRGGRRL